MLKEEDLELVLESLPDGVYVVDNDRRIRYWNEAASRITGFKAEEVLGYCCSDNILMHVNQCGALLCTSMCPLAATIQDGKPRRAEIYLHHKLGHRLPVAVRIAPLKDAEGRTVGGVEIFSDISSQKEQQAKLRELEGLALLDALTRLPNRRHLEAEIAKNFQGFRESDVPFGVLFLDIDRFKDFNDAHGHELGDLALQTVARTLLSATRPLDTVGRWGGEEFVGLFPGVDLPMLRNIAERLCMLVRTSRVESAAGPLTLTISIGGTLSRPGDTAKTLIRRADGLMYRSKESGRDRVTVDAGESV